MHAPHRLPVAPYCSTSTQRWPIPLPISATLNRVRADRGWRRCPWRRCAAGSHGARLLAAGFGIGKEHADFASLRVFLAYYAEALCEHTTLFPEADRVLAEIELRGLRWGIVTNKARASPCR